MDNYRDVNQNVPGSLGMNAPLAEGKVTSKIEQVTARAPSSVWLWLAGGAIAASVALFAARKPLASIFIGLWPPTFLIIGNYNKMVKQQGSF